MQWAAFDRQTAELAAAAVTGLLNERTRVVAVTGASNLLGTRPDVAAIAAAAHNVGALVYVDGVHLTPHAAVDVTALGADFFACSPYKFFGPHLGVVVADPALLETLHPDKLLPSSDAVPERFELGTLPYELMAGTTATVDFIADLVPGDGLTDGTGCSTSMTAVEEHEARCSPACTTGSAASTGSRCTATLHGVRRRPCSRYMERAGARCPSSSPRAASTRRPGSFYALAASRGMGLGDDGAVRAGLAPYTSDDDVDRLLEGSRRRAHERLRRRASEPAVATTLGSARAAERRLPETVVSVVGDGLVLRPSPTRTSRPPDCVRRSGHP